MAATHLRLPLLCLAVAVLIAASAELHHHHPFPGDGNDDGFRAELNHPYADKPAVSVHYMWRRSARASMARAARLNARLRLAGNMPVPLAHISDQGYTVTVGIGTPPQPHALIVDTASDLTWTQCSLFNKTARQREPLFHPSKSSSFAFVPCNTKLCTADNPGTKRCSNKICRYEYPYVSVEAVGVLAYEAFTFGERDHEHHRHRQLSFSLSFGFGCGAITGGDILGASGIMGLSPAALSVVSQLAIPKFSYCLTPYADRKSSPLFLGAMADLRRYKTTGPIQSVPILRNPPRSWTFYYYLPLVGLSLGNRRLQVPTSAFSMKAGGTVLDSGSTIAQLVRPAFDALMKAVVHILDLPLTNKTVDDYHVCFALPSGVEMSAVKTPPLVLHFDGGANMVLPKENYFQEPRPGLMCLAVVDGGGGMSIIGNVQQQNFHVLYDVQHSRLFFAPTSCDDI